MKVFNNLFEQIVSLENLFAAWQEFHQDKKRKLDVQKFEFSLEQNVFQLHRELKRQIYKHGPYETFYIYDPKYRVISKAAVKDRLVHHLVFKELYRIFDPIFIYHSYSSRTGKGTHLAVKNLSFCLGKVSKNHTHPAYVLKCDIKKFFHSVSHQKLLDIIKNKVKDTRFLWLINEIVSSFSFSVDNLPQRERERELKGVPIGNVTSQIFANIYLNQLDQFIKHRLKVKHYFRYADDFVIGHHGPDYLKRIINPIQNFLKVNLDLALHPQKIQVRKFRQGIDFLGYVVLPHHMVLRTRTRKRMFKKIRKKKKLLEAGLISKEEFNQSLRSYFGVLSHADCYDLSQEFKNQFWSANLFNI